MDEPSHVPASDIFTKRQEKVIAFLHEQGAIVVDRASVGVMLSNILPSILTGRGLKTVSRSLESEIKEHGQVTITKEDEKTREGS